MASQGAAPALPDLPEFLSASWRLFKARWTVAIAITVLGAAASLAGAAVPFLCAVPLWGHVPAVPLLALAALVAVFAFFWLSSWTPIAMFEAVLDDSPSAPDVWGCISKSRNKIVPFSWTYILFFLLIFSGFWLFAVPGLYLCAALSVATIACVAEGVSGLAAMEKSLYYVRGRWWPTFLRLIVIGLVGFIPSVIPVLGLVISALISPLPLAMVAVLYKDLRATREAQGPAYAPNRRARLWLLSALLGLLVPLLLASAISKAMRGNPDFEAQWQSWESRGPGAGFSSQRLSGLKKPQTGSSRP
ncbi:MAG: hypothetical protein KGL04_09625 [Elusimicrobia bacterium]|nr:hypothetical protein [Elusimicrobiota bacterium]MDE2314417.1 hypothetical protein [Elusimicrobiota bacterium]